MPPILYMADSSKDIVMVNITEEENKEKEAIKDIKLLEISHFYTSVITLESGSKYHFDLGSYKDYQQGVLSPPPEFI